MVFNRGKVDSELDYDTSAVSANRSRVKSKPVANTLLSVTREPVIVLVRRLGSILLLSTPTPSVPVSTACASPSSNGLLGPSMVPRSMFSNAILLVLSTTAEPPVPEI
jgi:hypothetical protein